MSRVYTPIDDARWAMSEARQFLQQLAAHLEANEMPGQAGNCMNAAAKLTTGLYRLDELDKPTTE